MSNLTTEELRLIKKCLLPATFDFYPKLTDKLQRLIDQHCDEPHSWVEIHNNPNGIDNKTHYKCLECGRIKDECQHTFTVDSLKKCQHTFNKALYTSEGSKVKCTQCGEYFEVSIKDRIFK